LQAGSYESPLYAETKKCLFKEILTWTSKPFWFQNTGNTENVFDALCFNTFAGRMMTMLLETQFLPFSHCASSTFRTWSISQAKEKSGLQART